MFGKLTPLIEQNTASDFTGIGLDVDFIAWGPFTETEFSAGVCGSLTGVNIVPGQDVVNNTTTTQGCSYSGSDVENFNILGATAGEYYVLMITNYNGSGGFIRMTQTIGGGSTDCSILESTLGPDINACDGGSIDLDGTTTGATDYKWFVDTGSGFVEIIGETNPTLNNITTSGIYQVEVTDGTSTDTDEVVVKFSTVPVANMATKIKQCDDDNDGIWEFDLTSKANDIIGAQNASQFTLSYFTSQADADANNIANSIGTPSAYINTTNPETIFVRIHNNDNKKCYDTTSFEIEVYDKAIPLTSVTPLTDCDNTSFGTDTDGIIVFDLTQKEAAILNGQLATDFTLTYFTDSGYTTQIATPSTFTNSVGGQTIYVRMTNNFENSCFADTFFKIEVFELPVLNAAPFMLEQCDDDFDGFNIFNLTEINTDIVTNITSEVFTYYESQADAIIGNSPIANPIAYQNQVVNVDNTIWARIENGNGCYRVAQITLVVKLSAIPTTFLRTFSQCDDGANNRNGISTFDFSSVATEVQAMFPATVDVYFYRNQADATSEINEITDPSNYQNIGYVNIQKIWVRADSQLGNDCLGNGHHITLIVEALPVANKPTDLTMCDDNQDGIFPFDTSNVETEILNGQSLLDVTITYFNEDGTLIGTSLTNSFSTASQTIDVVVANNTTSDIDGACVDTTTLTFIVDVLPINNTVVIPPLCDQDPNDGLVTAEFDTSILETSIGTQTGMDITYFDTNGNPLQDLNGNFITSPFPSTFTTETQSITVVVTNPINTTCPITNTIDFVVYELPEFDLETETLVCENILPHEISVENPAENDYIYEWFNSNNISIGSSQTLSITNTDDITVEGVDYSVITTNPTTGCQRTKTIRVWKSSIANITDEDIITVEFNSPENSIEIITTNLGVGDYEFALQNNGDSRYYQDEPLFTGLLGGIYTLQIRDKNNCGVFPIDIVLIDYPKFLTPNNDGYNDTWKLVGLESSRYTVSPIQIFDRFGKLIAVIDSSKDGWDGIYNGKVLPSSDYWFTLNLTDNSGNSTLYRGNFSLIRR